MQGVVLGGVDLGDGDPAERGDHRGVEKVGRLFGADPNGMTFGPNMTTLTMAFSRSVGATLRSIQLPQPLVGAPAVGDLDRDGVPDVYQRRND